jgi:hypothetical protein
VHVAASLQIRYACSSSFRSAPLIANVRFAIPVLYDFYLLSP